MLTFIVAVVVFSILVVIHEFGHFIIAKLSGIKVEEFALGMGPKIVGKQFGETLFSIRAFPLGGFCKMLGEDQDNPDPRAFNNKPVWKRIGVIAFGPIMNLLLAVVILSMSFAPVPKVGSLVADRPAIKAGMAVGDKIVAINQVEIKKWDQIPQEIAKSNGNPVHIKLESKGQYKEIDVKPYQDSATKHYMIGISPSVAFGGFSLNQGVTISGEILREMFKFLGNIPQGKVSMNDVAGPVRIIGIMGDAAKTGLLNVLWITAILSMNLFLFNLLPIPALDGGRLVFLIIEAIRRKPVSPEKEGLVHFIGFVALMGLVVFISYREVLGLFK